VDKVLTDQDAPQIIQHHRLDQAQVNLEDNVCQTGDQM